MLQDVLLDERIMLRNVLRERNSAQRDHRDHPKDEHKRLTGLPGSEEIL
jgi:hypothetical protein